MGKMLYDIAWEGSAPTLEEVCERFGFGGDEVDHEFGVVATDPDEGSYAVVVEETAVQRIRGERVDEAKAITGPFANPRIEPFDLQ
jgi:hypothetical protein